MAKTKLVQCPETSLLERIEYITDRRGEVLLVIGCTRFDPPLELRCSSPCADQAAACGACSMTPERSS